MNEPVDFASQYSRFLDLCRGSDISGTPRVPMPQVEGELTRTPRLNPPLIPPAHDWFYQSFDWYVGLRLVAGARYGPFYKVDGEHFWPTIGTPTELYSETDCFFGLERPASPQEAEQLYQIKGETPRTRVYEFVIDVGASPVRLDAFIWVGLVKGGTGYQANPNSVTVEIIRSSIVRGEVKSYRLDGNAYNYAVAESYHRGA